MSIPVATTTIAVLRPVAEEDPYEQSAARVIASGVRAHIGMPSGADARVGGDQSIVTDRLDCDPCDLAHYDQVRDETTGVTFQVVWVRDRRGLGLDHMEAGLVQVIGASNA